jgi:RNA polymerase sigma factor (sigma-70 family)
MGGADIMAPGSLAQDEALDRENEAALVAAARAGDRQSFATLFAEAAPRLTRHMQALARGGRGDDVEDLVQETGCRAFAAIGTFDGRSAFSTWVHGIADHVWLDYLRRRAVRRRGERSGAAEEIERAEAALPPPEARILAAESAGALEAALARIPERHRAVLVQRCIEGRSCQEIAKALGTTPNAVSILIYRAKSELRELLAASFEGEWP